MPSASNVKIEKQVNATENASLPDSSASSPLKQIITLMEHKIRNLEKRKSKLDSYRDLQNAGKELIADQKTALAKYSEVIHTLEFARDVVKQFAQIAIMSEKEAKKQAKKEVAAKNQAELARLREILLVQDALHQMGNEVVREDFLQGRNGAAQLTEADLKLLDDLYPAVTPKHEAGNPTAFTNEVQTAAEHLLAVVDGKPKEIFGGTYSQIKEILGKIHESGYFDQVQTYEAYAEGIEAPSGIPCDVTTLNNHETMPQMEQQLPPLEHLSLENMAPPPSQSLPQLPPQPTQMMEPNLPIVESQQQQQQQQAPLFYQQQQQALPPQQSQPPRPITEMLGTGSFFFLQESEIDPAPEQIPTQTFTNQNFVAGPPPPIPLPHMFQPQQAPLPPSQPQASANLAHTIPPSPPSQQQQQQQQLPQKKMPQNQQQQQQQQQGHLQGNNNGLDDTHQQKSHHHQQHHHQAQHKIEDVHNKPAHRQQRSVNNQPYYQNNNGYNQRPRQNRNHNGPRSGNRHNN